MAPAHIIPFPAGRRIGRNHGSTTSQRGSVARSRPRSSPSGGRDEAARLASIHQMIMGLSQGYDTVRCACPRVQPQIAAPPARDGAATAADLPDIAARQPRLWKARCHAAGDYWRRNPSRCSCSPKGGTRSGNPSPRRFADDGLDEAIPCAPLRSLTSRRSSTSAIATETIHLHRRLVREVAAVRCTLRRGATRKSAEFQQSLDRPPRC